ncbi:MAG: chromosomal replication initiator DnaA [Bradyrhizobiaceae bacterium]|nr:chromosomal replication initiator DnaA [Bradyrhizobiaceae bacterium]
MSVPAAESTRTIVRRPVAAPGGERASSRFRPQHRPSDPRRACRQAARLAAAHYEVTLREIAAHVRTKRVTRARHVAMYLAHVVFGLSFGAVAAAFGRDRKTVVHAVRLIEGARDNPAFDATLAGLEIAAAALLEQEKAAA